MRRDALENSIPEMRGPLQGRRMAFPSIQFAGWLGWLAGMTAVQAGAAVAFAVMPALIKGHREASFAGGTLFLGGCLAVFGANQALVALQKNPNVVTRWFGSCVAGLAIASATVVIAGLRGGADLLSGIGGMSGAGQALVAVAAVPAAALPVVLAIAALRGGVLKRVEPAKVATGSRHAGAGRWVRRAGGAVLLVTSGWCWWAFSPPSFPDLSGFNAKGHSLQHWYGQWRESGHTRGVDAFEELGAAGTASGIEIANAILTPRARARAARLRGLAAVLKVDFRPALPLKPVLIETDVSEPVVRVLARACTRHPEAAAPLKRFVAEHESPPIQNRAFVALVEGGHVEGAEGAEWIRTLLTTDRDPAVAALLRLRLKELSGD